MKIFKKPTQKQPKSPSVLVPTNSRFIKNISLFNIVFLGLFAILVMCAALAPVANKFGLHQPTVILFVLATAAVFGLILLANVKAKSKSPVWLYPVLVTLAFAAILFVQLVIAHALRSYGYQWDTEYLFNNAVFYATNGYVDAGFVTYLENSPNNLALFTLLGGLFKAVTALGSNNFLSAAILVNVCVMFVSQILIFFVSKMLFGKKIAAISLIFSFVLITLSMYVQIPYTDTLTMVFPVLILFFALRFVKSDKLWVKYVYTGLIGAVTIIGFELKPTVLIATVAVIITCAVWVVAYRKQLRTKAAIWLVGGSFAVFSVVAGLTYVGYGALIDHLKLIPYPLSQSGEKSLPAVHFMNIGTKTKINGSSENYGGYDADTVDVISDLGSTNAKVNYSIDAIKKQLGEYGVAGYANFLGHKINWIISDGTFFAYGEGDNSKVVFTDSSAVSMRIRDFMYVDGKHYILFGNMLQVAWLSVLLLIAMQFIIVIMKRSSRVNLYMTMIRLMIVGILVFLLMFEGRSRYIFLYLPIFIIAALYTLNWFKDTHGDDVEKRIHSN
jgi:Dolichyl-phosphate-mannose-protein mannosyltransferase